MEKGLSQEEVEKQRQLYGSNEISVEKGFSAVALFISQFPTFINAILAVAGVFSFFISDVLDSIFIFSIIIINSVFGFIQEYNAEKSLEKLKNLITPTARVIRDGKDIEISTKDIVPADVVVLSEGDRIPADGKLITHHSLEIDESILTGESMAVEKNNNDTIYSGSLVVKGSGKLLVEKIGLKTRFGQIAETLSLLEPDRTPLQKQLTRLGKFISILVLVAALSLIPIGSLQHKEFIPLVLLAISIGVAAIPESLPAVLTIALAIGTSRMAKLKAIIRKMPAIETLGATQVLLVDKTGTLTQNSMRVKKVWLKDEKTMPLLIKMCIIGNTASLVQKANNSFDALGDKTDGALLLWAHSQLKNVEEIKKSGRIIDEYSFDPETKTITTIWEEKNLPAGRQGKKYVLVRGAPEQLLQNCKLTRKEQEKITKEFEEQAKKGYRIIGFATKLEKHHEINTRAHAEKHLEFVGFLGLYDPPRPEAMQAVHEAQKAGIQIVMVTGDNELTALTIAKEVGLIENDEDVLTSEELKKLSDEELEKILLHTRIFARTTPEDKLRLVTAFKKLGYVVGVTGDGVNDALALKRSDVGIAMGETGTDVAKDASDIVLTDDNFSSLVHAVEEGRTIYQNILTAITYLLTGNLAQMTLLFLTTILALPNPLLPTQILWINLITDGLPALALAADSKDSSVLNRPPRDPDGPFLSKERLYFIAFVGITLGVALFVTFSLMLQHSNETFARITVFNMLVFIRLAIAFIVREKSIFSANRYLFLTVIATALIQLAVAFLPFFSFISH